MAWEVYAQVGDIIKIKLRDMYSGRKITASFVDRYS
jgi:hypothetical protein